MRIINITDPHQKKHFEYFRTMNHPHFNICGNIDITPFVGQVKYSEHSFSVSVIYVLSRIANELPWFRRRLRKDTIVEHEVVHPSFTILPDNSEVFSFCKVPFQPDFKAFCSEAIRMIEWRKKEPSFEDDLDRDTYIFLSAIPWVSFTSVQHAMNYHPHDSAPRITWGKYFQEGERIKMPISVSVHHALADGRHVGEYFKRVEQLMQEWSAFLEN
jgi:chloramphenicol O-acetyltransferase type A